MIEIDNFIDKSYQDHIESSVTEDTFPWFYGDVIPDHVFDLSDTTQYVYKNGSNPHQFIHNLVLESEIRSNYFKLIEPLVKQLAVFYKKDIYIIRAKFNFLHKSSDTSYHYPHSDGNSKDVKTLIYYVNDSDGDTYLFNKTAPVLDYSNFEITQQVTPEKGKVIIFDALNLHSSSCPINSEHRIVLNINFKTLD